MTTELKYKTWPRLLTGQYVVAGDVVLVPPGATEADVRRACAEAKLALALPQSEPRPVFIRVLP